MLTAIYTVLSLQALILVLVLYLVLRRWLENWLERYAAERKRHFEPHVLNLLNDPVATEPLEQHLRPLDRGFIEDLLLQQAAQLRGADRLNMTAVFEKLGYVDRELRILSSSRVWWRRLEAAIDLGIMSSQNAVSVLIEAAVRDSNEDVRLAALRALGELNEPRGLGILLDALEEGRWHGSNIAEVIVGLGPRVAPEIALRLVATSNPRARLLYIQLCGLLRISAVIGPLIWFLRSPDKETRVAAAQALSQVVNESAVQGLITSLDDESWEVRAKSAQALGALGGEWTVARLKRALSDENWLVRHNAAISLYRLGKEGLTALREVSCTGPSVAHMTAVQILAEKALGV